MNTLIFIFALAILLVPVAYGQTLNSTNSTTTKGIDIYNLALQNMQLTCMNITAMGGSDPQCSGVIASNVTQAQAQAYMNLYKAMHK
jgi:hypothetical protein